MNGASGPMEGKSADPMPVLAERRNFSSNSRELLDEWRVASSPSSAAATSPPGVVAMSMSQMIRPGRSSLTVLTTVVG